MMENYKDKITQKKGISMVTLIITIVVATILASAGIVTVSNSIFDATLTAFANDLNTIQDQVKLYYIQNDEFPVFNSETAFSQGDIINLVSANGNSSEFEEELSLNGDFNDNSALGAFYKIDLSKLNVEKTSRGTKQDGDESDIYVVSYPSMNVYYLKGIKVKNVKYYSLSSKIVKYVKVADNASDDTSVTDLTTVGNISVKKLNKTWTNKLGINLNTYLNSGESLYINFGTEYKFNTTVGNNIFVFDTFEDLKSKIEVSDETVYNETVNNFIASTDKKMNIYIKDSSGAQLDNMEIDLNNYDVVAPIANNWNIVESAENNILTFNVADMNSGVKEVRYDYLQKYNENGELEKYYTGVNSLDPYFLKARGKKAKIATSGNVEISLPKEIEGIQIIVTDKAGNISLVTDEDGSQIPITKAIPTNIFIGSTLKSINSSGLKFKLAINILNTTTSGTLSSYTIQYSTDGDNYSSAITKTPTNSTNPYTEIITDYQTGLNITDSVYIKIIAITDKNIQKERIIKYSLSDGENIEDEEDVQSVQIVNPPQLMGGMQPIKFCEFCTDECTLLTTYLDPEWYEYIDQGTYGTDGKTSRWANAMTPDGSQWVWIPRFAYKIVNPGSSTASEIDVLFLAGTSDKYYDENGIVKELPEGYIVHPAFTDESSTNYANGGWDKELTGIWVAKYEAGYAGRGDNKVTPQVSNYNNNLTYPVFMDGACSYNELSISEAYALCRDMETSKNPYGLISESNSHLIKNSEWGAVAYLTQSKYGRNGNEISINDSSISISDERYSGIITGAGGNNNSTTGNAYGIFDMSGGEWEYTAGYLNNNNSSLLTYGNKMLNLDADGVVDGKATKYVSVYSVGVNDDSRSNYKANKGRIGEAIWETSENSEATTFNDDGRYAWFGDRSLFMSTGYCFLVRGGAYSNLTYTDAGLFAFMYDYR